MASNVKKLLQTATPVSHAPFSRTAPPTNHELSMLLNRFSDMAVAIHLDPMFDSASAKLVAVSTSKRQVRLPGCIYDEILGCLVELANVLMDDYREAEAALLTECNRLDPISLGSGAKDR
ncbi:hypothetical protein EDD16DRAFT_455697 [Pisolithus croceorrhizus]|nr:hypothetical protein EV401DRAFT_672201 [Pisolithus croceorrhizus]KAI6125368.1 hypothetical protein EDD16DRAFT_455697 [Pisolithus croceorrhizus]